MPDFATGFETGTKFYLLAQQLKQAKLEQAEFEAGALSRRALERIRLERENAAAVGQTLQNQLIQQQLLDVPVERKRAAAKDKREAVESKTRVAESESGIRSNEVRTNLLQSQLAGSELDNVSKQLGIVGTYGATLTDEDFANGVTEIGTVVGIKDPPGSTRHTVIANMLKGIAGDHTRQLQETQEKNKAARLSETISRANELVDAAARTNNPIGTIQALADLYKNDPAYQMALVMTQNGAVSRTQDYVTSRLESAPQRPDVGENEYRKGIAEELSILSAKVAKYRAKSKLTPTEKQTLESSERQLEELKRLMTVPGEAFNRGEDGKSPSADVGTVRNKLPVVSTQAQYDALKPGQRFTTPNGGVYLKE